MENSSLAAADASGGLPERWRGCVSPAGGGDQPSSASTSMSPSGVAAHTGGATATGTHAVDAEESSPRSCSEVGMDSAGGASESDEDLDFDVALERVMRGMESSGLRSADLVDEVPDAARLAGRDDESPARAPATEEELGCVHKRVRDLFGDGG